MDTLILTPFSTAVHYVKFNAAQTLIITNAFIAQGSSGNVINILSNAASNTTLSMASGCPANMGTDYCAFTYIVGTGGANWKVGANSTLSNCTGLAAEICPIISTGNAILNGVNF